MWIIFLTGANAQTISGNLSLLANQAIKLEGFNGLKTYPISTTTSDSMGNFNLQYTKADHGIGYLMSVDNKPLFVILSGEDMMAEALMVEITPRHYKICDFDSIHKK